MNQSFHLFQLQKIDSQLDNLNKRIHEIDGIIAGDRSVVEAQDALSAAKANHQKARHHLSECEDRVSSKRIKIEQSEANLYSGSIKNPKELQDLQMEIGSLKRHLADLEDLLLEAMLAMEDAENELKNAESNLEKATANSLMQHSTLNGERDQLIKLREKLATERGLTVEQITPENLEIYLRLRKTKKGAIVVQVEDGTCAGCGSTLPPAEWQASRSPLKITFCSSCGRILYSG